MTTPTQTYLSASRRFLAQARQELAAGDIPQASEKGWGAAAQMVKAVAQQRGWEHGGHRQLFRRASSAGSGNPEIRRLFDTANSLHINFYEDWKDARSVAEDLDDVARFIDLLEPADLIPEENAMTTLEYRSASRTLLAQARAELAAGDLRQASEKGWGAAAQMVKAVAQQRGWEHGGHRQLFRIVRLLQDETGNPEIRRLFNTANSLHINFYEDGRTPGA